jgi:hypothetical protein
MPQRRISLWIKIPYTIWACVHFPVYLVYYGPVNFLWFSNVAFLAAAVALWAESRLWASTMAVAVALPEMVWAVSYLGNLFFGVDLIGLAGYMFDPGIPEFIRGISLYHLFMPPVLIWMLHRLGYDPRALRLQTMVAWILLPASYVFASPDNNVNWVFGPGDLEQQWMPGPLWVALLMVFFPLAVYLPSHLLFKRLFHGVR